MQNSTGTSHDLTLGSRTTLQAAPPETRTQAEGRSFGVVALVTVIPGLCGSPACQFGMSRLLVHAARAVPVQDVLREWLGTLHWPRGVRVTVDVDPYSFL